MDQETTLKWNTETTPDGTSRRHDPQRFREPIRSDPSADDVVALRGRTLAGRWSQSVEERFPDLHPASP
jgi:hypothetical protein